MSAIEKKDPLENLHAIREKLYLETKGLAWDEQIQKIHQAAVDVAQKYHLNLPSLASVEKTRESL